MDNEQIPILRHCLELIYENILRFNDCVQSLRFIWAGHSGSYPMKEIEIDFIETALDSDEVVTTDIFTTIEQLISEREEQFKESMHADYSSWESSTLRDDRHISVENILPRIREQLDVLRHSINNVSYPRLKA
jgi:hypothetical protein